MSGKVLLLRNLRQTLERFSALLGTLCLGSVLLLTVSGGIGRGIARSASNLDRNSALTVLRVDSFNGPHRPIKPLTEPIIAGLRQIPGIEDVQPYVPLTLRFADEDPFEGGFFHGAPRIPWIQPRVIRTIEGLSPDHVLVGDEGYFPESSYGVSLARYLGQRVPILFSRNSRLATTSEESTLRVVGLYAVTEEASLDVEGSVYVSDTMFRTMVGALLALPDGAPIPDDFDYARIYIKATSTREMKKVLSVLGGKGYTTQTLATKEEELPAILALLSSLNDILGVMLLVFCVGVGLSLGGDWATQRRWDVGVLTSLGWSRGRVLRSYSSELLILGAIVGIASAGLGGVASLACGFALTGYEVFGAKFVTGPALPPAEWLVAVAVGIPAAILLGAIPRVLWLAGLPPDVALRRMAGRG